MSEPAGRIAHLDRFEAPAFRDALSCSLALLGADPLKVSLDANGREVWQFPQLDRRAQADQSWTANHRAPMPPGDGEPDLAYAFQAELEVACDRPLVPRPDLRGGSADEMDDRIADLHYADAPEYASGHGVSAEWELVEG